jgi:hypothetical protein
MCLDMFKLECKHARKYWCKHVYKCASEHQYENVNKHVCKPGWDIPAQPGNQVDTKSYDLTQNPCWKSRTLSLK